MANGTGKDDSFLWGLIMRQNTWYYQTLGVVGIWAIFFVPFVFGVHPIGAAILAGTFIVHIYLHECGHAAVYKANGLKTHIWFVFPMGAIAGGITPEEDAKTYGWPNWTLGWATLAGTMVNTGLILLGIWLRTVPNVYAYVISVGLIMNGAVSVVLNLLPVWQVDGNVVMHSAFGSLDHVGDRAITTIMSIFTVIIVAIALVFPRVPVSWAVFGGATPAVYITAWIIFPIALAVSTHSAYIKLKDEPIRPLPMSWAQAFTQELLFVTLFAFSMISLFGI